MQEDDDRRPHAVEVTIGARTYEAVLDWRAIEAIESSVGPLARLVKQSTTMDFGVIDTARIVREAIRAGSPKQRTPSLEEIANAVIATGLAAWANVRIELLQPAFSGPLVDLDDDGEAEREREGESGSGA